MSRIWSSLAGRGMKGVWRLERVRWGKEGEGFEAVLEGVRRSYRSRRRRYRHGQGEDSCGEYDAGTTIGRLSHQNLIE